MKESDYTKDSWDKMMSELEESKELLASDNPLQSAVKEQTIHMTEAMEALVKVEHSVDTTEIEKAVAEAEGLKESDYTARAGQHIRQHLQMRAQHWKLRKARKQ